MNVDIHREPARPGAHIFSMCVQKDSFGEMKGCRTDVGLRPRFVLLRDIRKYGDGDVAIELYTFTP